MIVNVGIKSESDITWKSRSFIDCIELSNACVLIKKKADQNP